MARICFVVVVKFLQFLAVLSDAALSTMPFDLEYEMALSAIQPHQRLDLPIDIGVDHLFAVPHRALLDLQYDASYDKRQLLQRTGANSSSPGTTRRPLSARCRLTRGDWCGKYERQNGLQWKPALRGFKPCPGNCSKVGNCNHDTGLCDCPAGWTGPECATILLRPCTNRYRVTGNVSIGHVDANGRDLDWETPGWMASRCPGVCDTTTSACYCDGPYGHIPPPLGSPPGTPPIKQGRMLGDHCFPRSTLEGTPVLWGNVDLSKVYGPKGHCMVEVAEWDCGCYIDGHHGRSCEERYEMLCINQCSGHGTCWLGFCKCDEGWYGTDCMRKVAGSEMEPPSFKEKPHIQPVSVIAPEAQPNLPSVLRKRPLIYVYDLPAEYNSRMQQYKIHKQACAFRHFGPGNNVVTQTFNVYSLEAYFHEVLLQSEHRTFDPEEADYFYVHPYTSCLIFPVFAWADGPWWPGPVQLRPLHAATMLLEVKRHIQQTYPYWNRTHGKDHIWMANHDEGACWFPTEIYENSTILTHWGRLDPDHKSNTAFEWDNYSKPVTHEEYLPQGWEHMIRGHPCYRPDKDLVIPSFKWPSHYSTSPLLAGRPHKRDILMYFKGDVGTTRLNWYSRMIRQRLYILSLEQKWLEKYNIHMGFPHDLAKGYSEWLTKSIFCLVAPGDGWSSRAEDAVLHGCIPVVIMDEVHTIFESLLDWDLFSVRIKENQIERLPQILLSIPEDRVARMQRRLTKVWHRFAYTEGKLLRSFTEDQIRKNKELLPEEWRTVGHASRPRELMTEYRYEDDAFSTIIQWLYSRIPATRALDSNDQRCYGNQNKGEG
ncbi:hypothetical protein CEUSTIGMA_g7932.t1 [Chlamydomonas eustigma]|uniref:EGF-like domain-containing protein n=1 Tax=Chlamydomonas eustigma TaxID=1157962 RepID=A0A250XBP5_9CHLO|nr:hypothetical protein CEUSTIGMA_g7932.t1 [Chlamydomonas eustigma]|eukprot:GAX80494.1 hypothetical protein CEUSTIGMA_g7932.t1 [Chlamydomonas eustigma]